MRSFVVDLFKALAAQLIVLHHLLAYGPLAVTVSLAFPLTTAWFYEYARMAVQVFIVIAGYLAARSLNTVAVPALLPAFLKRYLRLVLPFLGALVLTCLVAALLRPWFNDEAMPAVPSLAQLAAHALLVHGVFGFESLSAGAWYVAIDFQLYVLFMLLAWLGGKQHWHLLLVTGLTLLSLFHFNRQSELDDWALYFFGAYGLGVIAFHISQQVQPGRLLLMLCAIVAAALWLDFRGRIVVAASTAVALIVLRDTHLTKDHPLARGVAYLGLNSYALFLVHFSLCLLGNALFVIMGWSSPAEGLAMLLMMWLFSNLLADRFYQYVERPAVRLKWWTQAQVSPP